MSDSYSYPDHEHHEAQSPATVHETVCVQAEVMISPDVKVGDIKYYSIDESHLKLYPKLCLIRPKPTSKACTFEVSQKICVEIPLSFSVKAKAHPRGIICSKPLKGECPGKNDCKKDSKGKLAFLRTIWNSDVFKKLLLENLPIQSTNNLQN